MQKIPSSCFFVFPFFLFPLSTDSSLLWLPHLGQNVQISNMIFSFEPSSPDAFFSSSSFMFLNIIFPSHKLFVLL